MGWRGQLRDRSPTPTRASLGSRSATSSDTAALSGNGCTRSSTCPILVLPRLDSNRTRPQLVPSLKAYPAPTSDHDTPLVPAVDRSAGRRIPTPQPDISSTGITEVTGSSEEEVAATRPACPPAAIAGRFVSTEPLLPGTGDFGVFGVDHDGVPGRDMRRIYLGYNQHVGITSSYGAFIHSICTHARRCFCDHSIPMRLHGCSGSRGDNAPPPYQAIDAKYSGGGGPSSPWKSMQPCNPASGHFAETRVDDM